MKIIKHESNPWISSPERRRRLNRGEREFRVFRCGFRYQFVWRKKEELKSV